MTEKIDTQTKLELLKLTIELTKFAFEKGAFIHAGSDTISFTNAFESCSKLISDTYYQEGALQTNPSQTVDE